MNENEFEGTLVLEKLSEIGRVDEFYNAVDADDFKKVSSLMRRAGLDSDTIQQVLAMMADASRER